MQQQKRFLTSSPIVMKKERSPTTLSQVNAFTIPKKENANPISYIKNTSKCYKT